MGGPEYTIDDETLREVLIDEVVARQRLAELEALGPSGDDQLVALLRMLGDLEEAEAVGWKALAKSGGPADRSNLADVGDLRIDSIAPAIRLANVLHWREDYETAEQLYLAALQSIDRLQGDDGLRAARLEAFTHQHLGKMRFDQGRLDDALSHFDRALLIRREIDAPADQISSSLQAVAATKSRLAGST